MNWLIASSLSVAGLIECHPRNSDLEVVGDTYKNNKFKNIFNLACRILPNLIGGGEIEGVIVNRFAME